MKNPKKAIFHRKNLLLEAHCLTKRLLVILLLGVFLVSFTSAYLWDDLVVYYNLDDNLTTTNVIDSLMVNNGTSNNNTNVFSIEGLINTGFNFTSDAGKNYYFNSTNTSFNFINGTNFTLQAWVNIPSGKAGNIFHKFSAKGYYVGILNSSNYIQFAIFGDATTTLESLGGISPNVWHHLVAIRNGTSMSLYIDGVLNNTKTGASGNLLSTNLLTIGKASHSPSDYYLGKLDELGIWNRSLTEDEIDTLYNGGNGFGFGSEEILVTLISPANASVFSTSNISFNASFTSSATINFNLTNATLWVWNSTSIFNNTETKTITGTSNYSTWNITNFSLGGYKWNVLACGDNGTASLCNFMDSNFTFEIGAITIAEYYNNETYETATENFQINISLMPSTSLISAYLWYNGTPYVISDISTFDTQKVLKKTIDIPLNPAFTNTAKNFHWGFTFSNSGLSPQNTTTNQQNVSFINFQFCNATYNVGYLNFTLKEEDTLDNLNGSFESTFYYWAGTGNIKKNYSYANTSNLNYYFNFCVSPNSSVLKTDMESEYSASGFMPRTYYLNNATITNSTQNISLYLLNESASVKFFFTLTQSLTPVEDAFITISKYNTGTGNYETIGIRKSDESGKFVEYLELDKQYQFSVTKDGSLLGILYKTSTCSSTPCEMSLELAGAITDLWQGYYDIYADNVAYNLTFNSTSKVITFTFVDLSGLAQYFRLQVNKIEYNQTGATICNTISYTTAGTISCNLTGYEGEFRADGYISRSPELFVATIFATIKELLESIGKGEGLFWTFVLVITMALIGIWNPVVGIVLATATIFLSIVLGFLAVSYVVIVLIMILAVFIIVKMGRT